MSRAILASLEEPRAAENSVQEPPKGVLVMPESAQAARRGAVEPRLTPFGAGVDGYVPNDDHVEYQNHVVFTVFSLFFGVLLDLHRSADVGWIWWPFWRECVPRNSLGPTLTSI